MKNSATEVNTQVRQTVSGGQGKPHNVPCTHAAAPMAHSTPSWGQEASTMCPTKLRMLGLRGKARSWLQGPGREGGWSSPEEQVGERQHRLGSCFCSKVA